jgi:hypothetical protein
MYDRTSGSDVLYELVSGRIIPPRDKYTGEPVDDLLAMGWIIKKFCERRAVVGRAEADQLPDCL